MEGCDTAGLTRSEEAAGESEGPAGGPASGALSVGSMEAHDGKLSSGTWGVAAGGAPAGARGSPPAHDGNVLASGRLAVLPGTAGAAGGGLGALPAGEAPGSCAVPPGGEGGAAPW